MSTTRRQLMGGGVASAAVALLGACGGASGEPARAPVAGGISAADRRLLAASGAALPIVQRAPGGRGVLRRRAQSLSAVDLAQVAELERRMRATLAASGGGVGLAAPQVGVGARAILVMLDARGDASHVELFVNPRLVERSDEVTLDYEGCLSIAGVCGLVRRNRSVVVEHGLPGQPARRLAVTGFDARIFQHEVDHLDGVLYVDRVEGGLQPKDRLKELREQLRKRQPQLAHRLPAERPLLL